MTPFLSIFGFICAIVAGVILNPDPVSGGTAGLAIYLAAFSLIAVTLRTLGGKS